MQLMKVRYFITKEKKAPFTEWLGKLKDRQGRARILARINRLKLGNFGDCKPIGRGVYELKIDFGPGYRVYFARTGNEIIVILCGGTKKTQQADIDKAIEFWKG